MVPETGELISICDFILIIADTQSSVLLVVNILELNKGIHEESLLAP